MKPLSSQKTFSKLSTQEAVMKIHNFQIKQFGDIDKAVAWLEEVSPS